MLFYKKDELGGLLNGSNAIIIINASGLFFSTEDIKNCAPYIFDALLIFVPSILLQNIKIETSLDRDQCRFLGVDTTSKLISNLKKICTP